MDGDQLGAVWERSFYLNLTDHFGHAFHDRVGGQDGGAQAHDFGHGAAVANHFEDFRRDQRDRLGVIQLEATGAALPR